MSELATRFADVQDLFHMPSMSGRVPEVDGPSPRVWVDLFRPNHPPLAGRLIDRGIFGWDMDNFVKGVFPPYQEKQIFIPTFLGFLRVVAGAYRREHGPDIVMNTTAFGESLVVFAGVRGSLANGSGLFDRLSLSARVRLQALGMPVLKHGLSGVPDTDYVIYTPDDSLSPDFMLDCWKDSRRHIEGVERIPTGTEGRVWWVGKNFCVCRDVKGDKRFHGWRVRRDQPPSGVTVLTFDIGVFESERELESENDLNLVGQRASVGCNVEPRTWTSETARIDRRGGRLISASDNHRFLFVSAVRQGDEDYFVLPPKLDLDTDVLGRRRLNIFPDTSIFLYPERLPEALFRSVRQMASQVGLYYVSQHVASEARGVVGDLWRYIPVDTWNDYLLYELIGAVQLSPLTTAAHLLPEELLGAMGDGARRILANHGIAHTLSLGCLFQRLRHMTAEQADGLIHLIPDQRTYDKGLMYDEVDKPYMVAERQGLFALIQALTRVGLIPSGGTTWDQAMDLFCHPDS